MLLFHRNLIDYKRKPIRAELHIFAAVCLFWRRNKRRKLDYNNDMRGPQKAGLPGESEEHTELIGEAEVHETAEGAGPKEVPEMREPAALESGWTEWEAPITADTQSSESDQVGRDLVLSEARQDFKVLRSHRSHQQYRLPNDKAGDIQWALSQPGD